MLKHESLEIPMGLQNIYLKEKRFNVVGTAYKILLRRTR